jgi:hypothetical protein
MSATERWTGRDDVVAQLRKLWDSGTLLSARVRGEPLFPWTARLKRPTRSALVERFSEAQQWIRELVAGSKSVRAVGYEVIFEEVNHRQLGPNQVPRTLLVPTEDDALALIAKPPRCST